MSNEKLPAGCLIPMFIILGIAIYFSTKESPEEIKKENYEHNVFVSKYDYNPDSLASIFTYSNYYLENSDATQNLKGNKILVLIDYKGKISFKPKAIKLSDDLIAYKKSDLKIVILESYSNGLISELWTHGVTQEQVHLKFIDYNTRQLVYQTTILGAHRYESKSHRGSTTELHIYDSDIESEIRRIIR